MNYYMGKSEDRVALSLLTPPPIRRRARRRPVHQRRRPELVAPKT